MSSLERRRVRVSGIPADVQEIIAQAHPEMSINDFVVGVLANRYKQGWTPTGMASRRTGVTDSILVKMPEPIWAAVKAEAVPYLTMSAVIIDAIREWEEEDE